MARLTGAPDDLLGTVSVRISRSQRYRTVRGRVEGVEVDAVRAVRDVHRTPGALVPEKLLARHSIEIRCGDAGRV